MRIKELSRGTRRIIKVEDRYDWKLSLEQADAMSAEYPVLLNIEGLDMEEAQIRLFVEVCVDATRRSGKPIVLVNPTSKTLFVTNRLELPHSLVFTSVGKAVTALGGSVQ